jgi:stage V sporulation protein SpoVS
MDEFKNIAFPISKRLNYVSIARKFVNTQPLPLTYVPIFLDFNVKKQNQKKKYKKYSNKDIIYFK